MAIVTTRRTLTSLFTRLRSSPSSSTTIRSRFALPLLDHNYQPPQLAPRILARLKTSGSGYSPLPIWSNSPPEEAILLDGCDYEHWFIVMKFPTDPKPSVDEMTNSFVKTLASVLGSEEEAKKKIYSVSTTTYTGFGALISEKQSYEVQALPGVSWVVADSYFDVPNKDYGGDLFIDGKVIPRPQYRFPDRQQNTRPRPRPRFDKPRYDKRRETKQTLRREPTQREGRAPDRRETVAQPTAAQNGGGGGSPETCVGSS